MFYEVLLLSLMKFLLLHFLFYLFMASKCLPLILTRLLFMLYKAVGKKEACSEYCGKISGSQTGARGPSVFHDVVP